MCAQGTAEAMTTWKDSLERRDEVKAAFIEGAMGGYWSDDPSLPEDHVRQLAEKDWQDSNARKRLENPLG